MENQIAWAVQPSTWISFDAHGALWATSVNHARHLAVVLGVPCVLWACPAVGVPYALTHI